MPQHIYNLKPDPWHPSDVYLGAAEPLHTVALPPVVDLSPLMPPAPDQGQFGSCTAESGCSLRYGLARKIGRTPPIFSAMFLYYQERLLNGDVPNDNGSSLRTTMQVLSSIGVCPEVNDLYLPQNFASPPTEEAVLNAKDWTVSSTFRLSALSDMQACLASGYPAQVGIVAYPELESGSAAANGYVSLPSAGEQPLGGHAIVLVGYNMLTGLLKFLNSWGPAWGQGGYFTLPFAYIQPRLFMDAWTIR